MYTVSTKKYSHFVFGNITIKSSPIVRSVLKSACSEDFKTVLTFDQVEAEIIEVKDTRGHVQFSHKYAT